MKTIKPVSEVAEIETYVRKLTVRERNVLLKQLRRKFLMQEAKRLSKSVLKEPVISIEEIVAEVNKVRKNAA